MALATDFDDRIRELLGQLETQRALTEKQSARLQAHVAGESVSAIARREGVTPASVSESLASPACRAVLAVAGHRTIVTVDGVDVLESLMQNLLRIALTAERPVVLGNRYEMVADNRVRLDATLQLLSYIEPAGILPPNPNAPYETDGGAAAASSTVDEQLEHTTVETTLKLRRRRS